MANDSDTDGPSKQEVLEHIARTGDGAAAASRHFGGYPKPGTIRSWLRRERNKRKADEPKPKQATPPPATPPKRARGRGAAPAVDTVDQLEDRAKLHLRMAVYGRLAFLASPRSYEHKSQRDAAVTLGILLDKVPGIIAEPLSGQEGDAGDDDLARVAASMGLDVDDVPELKVIKGGAG